MTIKQVKKKKQNDNKTSDRVGDDSSATNMKTGLNQTVLNNKQNIDIPFHKVRFGSSAYPETMSRDAWLAMLSDLVSLGMNAVRLCDSAWGHLEKKEGEYQAEWLDRAIEDLHERGLRVLLGTSTYLAPQWLAGKYPDGLIRKADGIPTHPLGRHVMCLNHEGYRSAAMRLVEFLGNRYAGHPAVVGWQLDNEIDGRTSRACHCPNCEAAWQKWLAGRFGDVEQANQELGLDAWGFKITRFSEMPMPRWNTEWTAGGSFPPVTGLLDKRFQRDTIAGFLKEQHGVLTKAGITQPCFTDWMPFWNGNPIPVDGDLELLLGETGINLYPPSEGDQREFWRTAGLAQSIAKGATDSGRWFITETRIGTAGCTAVSDRFPTRDQLHMMLLQPLLSGADGLFFWSANRWTSGHWPHWGGLYTWSGERELEWPWVEELGSWIAKHADHLASSKPRHDAIVVTDYDQRAMLEIYPHVSGSVRIPSDLVESCLRLGLGVTAVSTSKAAAGALKGCPLVLLAGVPYCSPALAVALEDYVRGGGTLVVGPFVDYQHPNGPFRSDRFGSALRGLLGGSIRSVKRLGKTDDSNRYRIRTGDKEVPRFMETACEGWIEFWKDETSVGEGCRATLESSEAIFSGAPVLFSKRVGLGTVWRLCFWPGEQDLLQILHLVSPVSPPLSEPAAAGVIAIPRTDGGLCLVNTTPVTQAVQPAGRLRRLGEEAIFDGQLPPYAAFCLAPADEDR
jgi:beta-galactosidase